MCQSQGDGSPKSISIEYYGIMNSKWRREDKKLNCLVLRIPDSHNMFFFF